MIVLKCRTDWRASGPVQQRILDLVARLRWEGVRVSVAETLDALAAVGIVGVERRSLFAGLAAALVKDEADGEVFARVFEAVFSPGMRRRNRYRRSRRAGESGGSRRREEEEEHRAGSRATLPQAAKLEFSYRHQAAIRRRAVGAQTRRPRRSLPGRLDVSARELRAASPREAGEVRELVEHLARHLKARLSRRLRRMKRGRLDFRRTMRAAVPHGGAAFERAFRGRRSRKLDLVALLDLSHSVASASELFLALVSPSAAYFRTFRSFAYVDRLCEVTFEGGHVVPHERLDLYARSDFGGVLGQFTENQLGLVGANTVLLVLGDARNNRLPPRPDLLAQLKRRVRYLLWLNPEPICWWDTGDSVMSTYTRYCDAVLECTSLASLLAAVERVVHLNRRPSLRN